MPRVLLINMPFSSLRWPALGVSLLKAALARQGVKCDVAYLNFDFAEAVGLDDYEWINDGFGFVLGGERLFAPYHGLGPLPDLDAYDHEVLRATDPGFGDIERRNYEAVGNLVEPFLDECMARFDWTQYAVVGFTTTFQQTSAALALARMIKHKHPRITICFGGANCEGEMGRELLRKFPQIDMVFSGEADGTFPHVVLDLLADAAPSPREGVFVREETRDEAPASGIVKSLDDLPYPDFDDYFNRLDRSPLREAIDPLLLFETARGCWWGAKSQCTFCGLNGGSIAFRSKSVARVVDELKFLRRRYGVRRGCATDNAMDFRYYETLLPRLQDAKLDFIFEYELKTNLTRAQVDALVSAGLRAAQLGIESLATPILRLMKKGVTAVQNVQTLKWLSAAGVEVKWNFLYGFPHEDPSAYRLLPRVLRSLVHLPPPQAVGTIRIDRFSPYFERPEAFGLPQPMPTKAYRHVFPFDEGSLARVAYYFQVGDATDLAAPPAVMMPVLEALANWREAGPGTLRAHEGPDGRLILYDTRPLARAFEQRLSGAQRAIYLFCDSARSLAQISRFLCETDSSVDETQLQAWLDEWVEADLMTFLDGRYLSLALTGPSVS